MSWFLSCGEPLVSGVNCLQRWAWRLARRRTGTEEEHPGGREGVDTGMFEACLGRVRRPAWLVGRLERQVEARRP